MGVKGGGCSGFSYLLDLTETQKEHDEVFEQHGIKLICDPKSLLYLSGTTVDFKDEGHGPRVRIPEPQCHIFVRLWVVFLRLTAPSTPGSIRGSPTPG